MIHESLPVGPIQCNCHILACERTRKGIILDPGGDPDRIRDLVRDLGIEITHLVHTHCHLDHIGGTRDVKTAFPEAQILIHAADAPLYRSLVAQARAFGWDAAPPLDPDGELADDARIEFGDYAIRVLHTPGHTPGSCSFLLEGDTPELFSGDTLFRGSIGRTDLWGGDLEQELRSIRTRILTLPDDVVIHPGHGPSTHVGTERRKNPFLAQ
jgi:glyoxylase-like metal-dependent hydrolase (beta-lactamase superfamily II)